MRGWILALALVIGPLEPRAGMADVSLGGAFSGSTSGRVIPALQAGVEGTSFGVLLTSGGARTTIYAHSFYQLGVYRMWELEKLLWGRLRAGVGGGGMGGVRALRSAPGANPVSEYDWTVGPGFWVNWALAGPLVVSVDAFFGLRKPMMTVLLSVQDVVNAGIGLRF